MAETTIAGSFTIRWDTSMGCYRVSVPNLCSDGEPVEVVDAREYERMRRRYELAEDQKLQALDITQMYEHTLRDVVRHADLAAGESWERAYKEVTEMAREVLGG